MDRSSCCSTVVSKLISYSTPDYTNSIPCLLVAADTNKPHERASIPTAGRRFLDVILAAKVTRNLAESRSFSLHFRCERQLVRPPNAALDKGASKTFKWDALRFHSIQRWVPRDWKST